ncbi:MAG: TRAP transporter substrate-binding protein DctP [Xanthomonadaceae bacterium]|jgi:TRAP-type C4-dicarboxylate transport system substrate-binding protein|nr:TRAP transporter substrate-binding protein DctP [Xanthomonadaceae bacterium]
MFRHLATALFALVLAAPVGAATTLKIATLAPDGSGWMREMRAGAQAVKERTQGRVELKYFPGGVQGNGDAVLRKMRLGQLQGGAFASAEIGTVVADAQIYSLPFQFRSQAEVDAVRPTIDPKVRAAFEAKGFVVAGIAGGGFTYLMSSRPIRSRDDLRAGKVWFPQGDDIARVTFETGGVKPIALPLADVYTALSTGMVDTVGNTPSGAIAFQWHTRVKHMVDLPLTYVLGLLVLDKRAVDKLDAADRAVLLEEIDAAFLRIDAANRKDNEAARGALAKQGISIEAPAPAEQAFWFQIGADARRKLAEKQAYSTALEAEIESLLAPVRGAAR